MCVTEILQISTILLIVSRVKMFEQRLIMISPAGIRSSPSLAAALKTCTFGYIEIGSFFFAIFLCLCLLDIYSKYKANVMK